ncbi:Transferrin receptor-like, PAG-like [Trypanosoma congolense IL3000]|uniref:Transferrin receptor-like, PAG-like n=1 Tax=Trypanosoma congolense (strain IL3000) TaxID=1068625 RepID=F9WI82_TRYCI|nr:Transferrin receptor-like, PAG-like [Trypanosoma congolense IL3000]
MIHRNVLVFFLYLAVLLSVCHATANGENKEETKSFLTLSKARSICNASRTMKGVHSYVSRKITEYQKKYDEMDMIRDVARLKVLMKVNLDAKCGREATFLLYVQEGMITFREALEKLRAAGVRAVASAGIAAGRLDEFMSVFKQAHGKNNDPRNCAGKIGSVVDGMKLMLKECYRGATIEDGFHSVADVEAEFGVKDLELEDALAKHLTPNDKDLSASSDPTVCNLGIIKNNGSYVKDDKSKGDIKWGDGVLGVKKDTNNPDEWNKSPTTTIPVIKSAISDFSDFKKAVADVERCYAGLRDDWTDSRLKEADMQRILASLKYNKFNTSEAVSFHVLSSLQTDENNTNVLFPEWNREKVAGKILEEELALCDGKNGVRKFSAHWCGIWGFVAFL